MEKKFKKHFPPKEGLRKIYRRMKLTLVFTLLVFVSLGNSYSQVTNLSLNFKNADIREVLQSIEEQTNYIFLYKDEIFDFNKKFSMDFENKNFNEILEFICQQANVDFEMRNRQIILKEKSVSETGYVVQQSKPVTGKVTDSSGAPLPGVSVVIKGTTNGIITDADGKYSLNNVPTDATLVFSFVGMKAVESTVSGKSVI
ncbi:MAG TPA: SusC/RagA family TonB-linked outer membrane protein, partial [Prolixibacteraceae bacterium]|nr:SusC/RagA family TonB-linked outer membrane protein [Prolixibacteraceae bacterium]